MYKSRAELFAPGVTCLADSGYEGLDPSFFLVESRLKKGAGATSEFTRLRSRIEHSFGKLKALFHVVEFHAGGSLHFQAQCVLAACCLYNRLIRIGVLSGAPTSQR